MELIIKREMISDKRLCRALVAGTFVILTALSAYVRIPLPFTPVPLTLQTFFVLLGAALMGRKLGSLTQAVYLGLGLSGISVFTFSGSGSLYLLGPTGGYVAGFILASFFAGRLLDQEKAGRGSVFFTLLAADFIILASGSIWLKAITGFSFSKAFLLGFAPFVLGDILKVLLASAVYSQLRLRVKTALY